MKIVVCDNITSTANSQAYTIFLESLVGKIVELYDISSIEELIVTGNSFDEYKNAVMQHGQSIEHHINITNDEAGESFAIVLHGINEHGNIQQKIFVREVLVLNALTLAQALYDKSASTDDQSYGELSLKLIFHEIGHAIDYQNVFTNYQYSSPDKLYYLPSDLDEFMQHDSMSLWSEYYAERFAVTMMQSFVSTNLPLEVENAFSTVSDYINANDYPDKLDRQVNHAYRILYWFTHIIALFHMNGGVPFLGDEMIQHCPLAYRAIFFNFDSILLGLFEKERWDFCKDRETLAGILARLLNYEQALYSRF